MEATSLVKQGLITSSWHSDELTARRGRNAKINSLKKATIR